MELSSSCQCEQNAVKMNPTGRLGIYVGCSKDHIVSICWYKYVSDYNCTYNILLTHWIRTTQDGIRKYTYTATRSIWWYIIIIYPYGSLFTYVWPAAVRCGLWKVGWAPLGEICTIKSGALGDKLSNAIFLVKKKE